MSTFYTIKIKSVSGTKVSAEVRVDHADIGTDFDSKDFAVQILMETADPTMGYFEHLPITQEEWEEQARNHPNRAEFDKLEEYRLGRELPISKEEGQQRDKSRKFAFKKDAEYSKQYGMRVRGGGMTKGNYYITFESEPKKFVEGAAALIVKKPQKTKLEKNLYTLEFEVTDPSYVSLLREGMHFETAACNMEEYI
ncbi:MAG TPA: hypothetical protein VF676_09865 [Flavobacterium sp.]|jgi:hypothetical protein